MLRFPTSNWGFYFSRKVENESPSYGSVESFVRNFPLVLLVIEFVIGHLLSDRIIYLLNLEY